MIIPDLYSTNRSKSALGPSSTPEGCFPFWRWNVGVYHPYIVMPVAVGADANRTLRFKAYAPATGALSGELNVALDDQTGESLLSDYPGTVEAWVRGGMKANQYCLLFLSDKVANSVGVTPNTYGVKQPEDKVPLVAAGSHLEATLAKALDHEDVRSAIKNVVPTESYNLLLQVKAAHDAR